jgi:hypothetical protein
MVLHICFYGKNGDLQMRTAERILQDQLLITKRQKIEGGFEPGFNGYFDFYIPNRFFVEGRPLLQLEDVAMHQFLRKNYNPDNREWRPPGIRQLMKRLDMTFHRVTAMTKRLETAHLLHMFSGAGQGGKGQNITSEYRLWDPIQKLADFLVVAKSGVFGMTLRDEWINRLEELQLPESQESLEEEDDRRENSNRVLQKLEHPPVEEIATYNRLKKQEQGGGIWDSVLKSLERQLTATTFQLYVRDSRLLHIEDGVATIELPREECLAWVERQLSNNIRRSLSFETHEKITRVTFVTLTE